MGYVYIVKAEDFNRIKIGYWNGSKQKLRTRYVTCYGNDLTIDTYQTECAELLEKVFKFNFKEFCICCELYTPSGYHIYKTFLESYSKKSSDELLSLYNHPNQSSLPNNQQLSKLLSEYNLNYILDKALAILDRKNINYQIIANTNSYTLEYILCCIKNIPSNGIVRTIKFVRSTLLGFLIIRKFIEEANCVEHFQKDKIITIKEVNKVKYMNSIKDAIGPENFVTCVKYCTCSTIKYTDDNIKTNIYISRIMTKFLSLKSYRRAGSKSEHGKTRNVYQFE